MGAPDEDMSGFLCKNPRKKESVRVEVREVGVDELAGLVLSGTFLLV